MHLSVSGAEDHEPGDLDPLVENTAPHHTHAVYPMLAWELLSLKRHRLFQYFTDRVVEAEYVRFAFYSGPCRSAIPFLSIAVWTLIPHAFSQSFPWVTPGGLILGVFFVILGVGAHLQDRRKDSQVSYELVCKNCRNQEILLIFVGVTIAIYNVLVGATVAAAHEDVCSLCVRSLRGVSRIAIPLLYSIALAPRMIFQVPLLILQYGAFLFGWLYLGTFDWTEVKYHELDLVLGVSIAYLVVVGLCALQEKCRRHELESIIGIYLKKTQLEANKKQYCTFVTDLLPETALLRILRNEYVVDVAMEASVTHTELYDYSTWHRMHSAQHVVQFLNTMLSALDTRADATGMEKIETRGDCYTAVCGLSALSENHGSRACTFVLTLNRLVSDCVRRVGGHPIGVRSGVHSGPLLGLVLGDRMRYDVFGRAQGLAKLASSMAPRGCCYVTYTTQTLIATSTFFTAEPTKKKIPIAGVEPKNAVAFVLNASDAWDPDALVLAPHPPHADLNFTERIRESFLISTTNRSGALQLPNAMDIRSFAAYTTGGGRVTDRAGLVSPAANEGLGGPASEISNALRTQNVQIEEEFALILRVLKLQQPKPCLGRLITEYPRDVEEAHKGFKSDPVELRSNYMGCSLVAFAFYCYLLLLISLDHKAGAATIAVTAVAAGTALLGLLSMKQRMFSIVFDASITYLPWLVGLLILAVSDISTHFVLRDPVFFRLFSAIHQLTVSQRQGFPLFFICDTLFNSSPLIILVFAYNSENPAKSFMSTIELWVSTFFIVFISVCTHLLVFTRIAAAKRISSHRWIFSKIQRATELECAVYTALASAAFPPKTALPIMHWFTEGMKPEASLFKDMGIQILAYGTVSVRTVSLEDPVSAVSKLNALELEIERFFKPLKHLVRGTTNGDTILMAGPCPELLLPIPDGLSLSRSAADIDISRDTEMLQPITPVIPEATTVNAQDAMQIVRLDEALLEVLSFIDQLHCYGRGNAVSVTFVVHEADQCLGVVLGDTRLSYTLIGPDVAYLRRALASAPENGLFCTVAVSRRIDRLGAQRPNPMGPADQQRVFLPLTVGPISRWTSATDKDANQQVDMYQLQHQERPRP